jgi:hypothetical protein
MHKYFDMLAQALNDAGLDMRATLKEGVDIPWDAYTIKRDIWKPIQVAKFDIESTGDLETPQVGKIYEILNRHLSDRFGVHVPFPHDEDRHE